MHNLSEEYRDFIAFFSKNSNYTANIIPSFGLQQFNETIISQTMTSIITTTATTLTDAGAAGMNVLYSDVVHVGDSMNSDDNGDNVVDDDDEDDVTAFFVSNFNISSHNQSSATKVSVLPRINFDTPIWLIPCYSIIFICAIVGNLLVISTLAQNRRMRTITNVFLLNLAISDMLLGVFCMPVTLVGTLLRHFIFGEFLCKLIQFSQAASVAVSSWTLVAISCERYYAICHPLRSRTWQTINHAYKIIGFIWFGSIVCMTPIALFSQLIPTSRQGLRKCREHWPDNSIGYERSYNIFLDLILLVLPLKILCVAYILITRTLYVGMRNERAIIFGNTDSSSTQNKVNTQVEAVATVTTTTLPSTRFNFNMSLRCHSRNGANGHSRGAGGGGGGGGASLNSGSSGDSGNNMCISLANTKEIQQSVKQQKPAQQYELQQQLQQKKQDYGIKDQDTFQHSNAGRKKLLTPSEGHLQYYGMRSTSVKSLNRNTSSTSPIANNNAKSICNSGSISVGVSPSPSMTVINVSAGHDNQQQYQQQHSQQQYQHRLKLHSAQRQLNQQHDVGRRKSNSAPSLRISCDAALRRSNVTKNLESKRRVVKMLFVLVLEFFICWTPLYVINTVSMFIGPSIYEYIDYTSISFFQLLAYSSSCCNPITYCFMNAGFRRAFLDTFKGLQLNNRRFWRKRSKPDMSLSVAGNSITMANSITLMTNNTMLDSPRL